MSYKIESLFQLVVFVIFCVTAWFAIPGTFWPHAVLDVLGLAIPRELVWAGFAFQLAFLVSLYSLPVIIDPQRYRFNALVCAAVHFGLAVYWWEFYPSQTGMRASGMGLVELLMGSLLAGFLFMMQKTSPDSKAGNLGANI